MARARSASGRAAARSPRSRRIAARVCSAAPTAGCSGPYAVSVMARARSASGRAAAGSPRCAGSRRDCSGRRRGQRRPRGSRRNGGSARRPARSLRVAKVTRGSIARDREGGSQRGLLEVALCGSRDGRVHTGGVGIAGARPGPAGGRGRSPRARSGEGRGRAGGVADVANAAHCRCWGPYALRQSCQPLARSLRGQVAVAQDQGEAVRRVPTLGWSRP